MIRKIVKFFFASAFLVTGLAVVLIGLSLLYTSRFAAEKTYAAESAPAKRVAIVYGAGLQRDGRPAAVLRDRVATAVDLYLSGKVEKLLMSGDNRFLNYNEPGAMAAYAHSLGVPEDDIVQDFAGRRTYDTCFRAKHIFGLDEAVLVTQRFHLPRAIYTCSSLGIDVVGVPADRRQYSSRPYFYWNVREVVATVNALWEVHFTQPLPVLGDYEPIFPEDAY